MSNDTILVYNTQSVCTGCVTLLQLSVAWTLLWRLIVVQEVIVYLGR